MHVKKIENDANNKNAAYKIYLGSKLNRRRMILIAKRNQKEVGIVAILTSHKIDSKPKKGNKDEEYNDKEKNVSRRHNTYKYIYTPKWTLNYIKQLITDLKGEIIMQ